MLRVGLTGGLASGKSTVAEMLEDLGAAVLDADEIVRALYREGGAGAEAARELFGDGGPRAGRPRRPDAARRDRLHGPGRAPRPRGADPSPRGQRSERRFFETAEKARRAASRSSRPRSFCEAKTESDYDRVLLVMAPEEERVRRWGGRGGDPEDARRRISAQMRAEIARERADDVVVNNGTLEDLRRKVTELYGRWTA